MELLRKELILPTPPPTPQCHASTVAVVNGTPVAAWFAGTKESAADVKIWVSRREENGWTTPQPVTPEENIPHWNPVLFEADDHTLSLFYKLGYTIPGWHTRVVSSADGGKTWSAPAQLVTGDTSGGRGPVKNKPIRTASGRLLAPASCEQGHWRAFIDAFNGTAWEKKPIPAENETVGMIQPSLWEAPAGHIHALLRTNAGKIYRSDSFDDGDTWTPACPTEMPNNNSGLDCVCTEDGTVLLVCNPVEGNWAARSPLSLFASHNNGENFEKLLDLETEPGEYSYPAIIARGNRLFITYTYRRQNVMFCEFRLD